MLSQVNEPSTHKTHVPTSMTEQVLLLIKRSPLVYGIGRGRFKAVGGGLLLLNHCWGPIPIPEKNLVAITQTVATIIL